MIQLLVRNFSWQFGTGNVDTYMVDTDTSPPLDRHLFLLSIDDDLETMGRWGSKVPNSLVKITIQLFLGLCPKIGVAVGGWGPVLKVDAHGAHVQRTKESWEDQKAG